MLPFSQSVLCDLPFQLLPQRVHSVAAIEKLLGWQRNFTEALQGAPTFAVISATSSASIELQQSIAVQSAPALSAAFGSDLLIPEQLERAATADFTVFASPNAILHPSALFVLMKEVIHGAQAEKLADIFYGNELSLHQDGSATYFRKEQISPDAACVGSRYTQLAVNYFESFVVLSRRAIALILRNDREGLRMLSQVSPKLLPLALAQLALKQQCSVRHIPLGLSCVRIVPPDAEEIQARWKLAEQMAHQLGFTVDAGKDCRRETIWNERLFLSNTPADSGGKIQIVIPFRDQMGFTIKCLQSLLSQTVVRDLDVTLVDNNSTPESLAELEAFISATAMPFSSLSIVTDREYFNFARLNNFGAGQRNTPFILFLNNDVEVSKPNSLAVLRAWCALPDVALVGGLLRYPSGETQHAGINFSPFGPLNLSLPEHSTLFPREVNGVTFAMAMAKRCALEEVGGLDELQCPNGFGDALLGFELVKRGQRIVFTPEATGVHHESASRGASPEEIERYEMVRAGLSIPCHFEDFQVVAQPMFIKPHALSASPVYSFAKRLAGNQRVRHALLGGIRRIDRLLPKAK